MAVTEHHHWYCLRLGPCDCASRPCCCDGCPREQAETGIGFNPPAADHG